MMTVIHSLSTLQRDIDCSGPEVQNMSTFQKALKTEDILLYDLNVFFHLFKVGLKLIPEHC